MLNRAIARRYSLAYFSLAQEKGLIDQLEQELAYIVNVIEENPELWRFLRDPMVVVAAKKQVVEEIFSENISQLTLDFLRVILDKRREGYIKEIFNEYVRQANEVRNLVDVEVTSAQELSDSDLSALEVRLQKITGKRVRLFPKVDSTLIGGIVVRIGDKVIDGSVNKRLELLREVLLQG